jgi:hypothetical protein
MKQFVSKNPAPANRIDSMFSSETYFGTDFRVVVSSAEWLGTKFQVFAYILVPQNAIPSSFLFHGKVQNGIPSVCSTTQPLNCSTKRSGRKKLILYHRYYYSTHMLIVFFCSNKYSFIYLLLILFHSTEFRAFFSLAERFGTEFREFSVPRNSRNSAGINQLFRLFRLPRNNFFVGNCQPYSVPLSCVFGEPLVLFYCVFWSTGLCFLVPLCTTLLCFWGTPYAILLCFWSTGLCFLVPLCTTLLCFRVTPNAILLCF